MKAVIYEDDGAPRALINAPSIEAVERTAEGYGLRWREVADDVMRIEDAPPLED